MCRALVNQPSIILADEPTGNLDHGNADLVLEVVRTAAAQGRTVVTATHDPFVTGRADQTLPLSSREDQHVAHTSCSATV